MDTEFTGLVVENYGPFAGAHALKLNDKGVTFVKGRNLAEPALGANDAGKSTFLNALPWCLYGRTTNDLVATDLKPWIGKGTTRVGVKLIAWDGDEGVRHTIIRTANPNSLTLNGKPCSNEDIEKLVGWSLPVFRQAVFLGQGQPLFHDLPNREKLEFLVGVLGLSRWDTYAERAATKTTQLDRQLAGLVGEITANAVRAEELAAQVKRQQEEMNSYESWREGRLKEVERSVKALTKSVKGLKDDHAAISVKLDGAGLELKLVRADAIKADKAHAEAAAAHSSAKAAQIAAQEQHDEIAAQLAVLVKDRQCPTCGQRIERQSKFLANKRHLETQLAKFSTAAHETTVAQAAKALEVTRVKARKWTTQANDLGEAAEALEREERLLQRNLGSAETDLRAALRQRDELESGANPHRARLLELRKVHRRAVEDGEALAQQRAGLEAAVQRTRYWVKGFKDVRLYVLEDVLDELEFATNAMLDTMGLLGWEVRYDVERETKAGTTQRGLITTVLGPHKKADVKWKSWGGGVGQRLRLAGALALSQVLLARAGVECNLEVLDEPTAHLSPEGVDDLCDMLADRARALGKAVYLVDHKAIESTRFTRVVTVVKEKAGSRIAT